MTPKGRQAKQSEKVYRSIEEVRKHFFPNLYEKHQDPGAIGTDLIQAFLEEVRRELRRAQLAAVIRKQHDIIEGDK